MRRSWPAAVLGVLAGGAIVAAGCGGKSSTYALVRDGNHAYTHGDPAKALNDYRQAQVQRPDLPLLNYDAGNALYQQGDYTRGITESQQAAQNGADPLRAQAFYTIGADDYRQGKLQDALDAFKNALRIDPSDIDTKYNIELIQRQLDREAAARQGLPTPTPEPTRPPGDQGQSGGQQGSQPQGAPSAGSGQQQPGSGQPGQQGQQPGQSGQNQANSPANQPGGNGQQSPSGGQQQPGQPNGSQSAPSGGGSAGANGPGTTGTPVPSLRAQQQQAAQNLQQAIQAYQQNGSIDNALSILDALAQQQALQQQAQANQSDPHSLDK